MGQYTDLKKNAITGTIEHNFFVFYVKLLLSQVNLEESLNFLKSLWCNGSVHIWKSPISGTIEHNFVFYVKFPLYHMFMEENFHLANRLQFILSSIRSMVLKTDWGVKP